MSIVDSLLSDLAEFEASPESVGYDLRLDLAEIIVRELRSRGWTQTQLGARAGMRPAFINRVVHSNQNCTFEVAGRILHAFGLKGKILAAECGVDHGAKYNGEAEILETALSGVHDRTSYPSGQTITDRGAENISITATH